jgi:polyisoprenoid-binding protein YceI
VRKTIAWLVVSTLSMASPAWAEAPAYSMIKEKSFLKFVAIQNNAPVEGKFDNFTADIHFNSSKPEEGSIAVEVAVGSLVSGNEEVAKNLKLPEWLSIEMFPKAVFKSKTISRMPMSNNYYADGDLTLRGKTVPVVLNFQLEEHDNGRTIATGFVTLHRKDFGVGQGQWASDDVVKDEVRVEFRIVADKQ